MEKMRIESNYNTLVASLKLLALKYNNQVLCLPDFVSVQDEVVSIFEDAFLVVPQLVERKKLSLETIACVIRCYNFMEMATRNQESPVEFKNGDLWNKVRGLAALALKTMDEDLSAPKLDFIKWVD